MVNNELGVRFTEKKYATKNEVRNELKISVIDGIWDKVLAYRSGFNTYLLIKGIDKNQLRVCLCPTIANKSDRVDGRILNLINEYNKLNKINGDAGYYEQTNIIKCLQNVAVKKNLVSDEDIIRGIIQGKKTNADIANYYEALKYVKHNFSKTIDVDYLSDLYSAVTGNYELPYFYRQVDNEDPNLTAVISRLYKKAPAALISQMMDGLFNFIARQQLSSLNKAIVTFYYVEFVRPFKDYNDEIAVLLAKSVLAHDRLGEFAVNIPLESLINDNANEVHRLFDEVQSTSDVTYYLTYALDSVERIINKMIDGVAEFSTEMLKKDFYRLDDEPQDETHKDGAEQLSLFTEPVEEKKEEPKVQPVEPQPQAVREVVREIIREVPVQVTPVEEKKIEKPQQVVQPPVNNPQGLAVSFIPPELDEKTALRLEKHLLELDVRLKKGQAYFYARHCTLGMYYTIDQYKKAVKCVYETARTSMDQLVEFDYYRKEQVGKKFVYTPVERK